MSNTGGSKYGGGPALVAPVGNASLSNSGSSVGRIGVEVLLDRTALSAASSWSPAAWAAGAYRRLRFKIAMSGGSATTVTLGLSGTGFTGTYDLLSLYSAMPAPSPSAVHQSTWIRGCSNPCSMSGTIDIETGFIKKIDWTQEEPNGGGAGNNLVYVGAGYHSDTTHDVTALTCAFGGGTFTGIAELWGLP